MKILKFTLMGLALVLALGACKNKSKSGYSKIKLGQPFELKMNHSAQLEEGDLKLTFTGVAEDSRCPEGVNCIQEGQVRVSLVAMSAGENGSILFTQKPSQRSINETFGAYTVQLITVKPYPKQAQKIMPEDYVLTLNVKGN